VMATMVLATSNATTTYGDSDNLMATMKTMTTTTSW
jgi:hypothetical protein